MQAVTAFIFYERHWDTMTRRLVWSVAGDIGLVLRQIDAADVAGSVARLQDDAAALLDFGITYQPGVALASDDREPRDYVEETMRDAMARKVNRRYTIDNVEADRQVLVQVQLASGVLDVLVHRKRLYSSTTYILSLIHI